MDTTTTHEKSKRRPVNLTVRADILEHAKSLGLNASRAAEAGIAAAVKEARERQWLEENKGAIEAHNKRVDEHGPLIKAHWME